MFIVGANAPLYQVNILRITFVWDVMLSWWVCSSLMLSRSIVLNAEGQVVILGLLEDPQNFQN
jgi:hypothetical protein